MSRELTSEELARLTPERQAAYLKKRNKDNYKSNKQIREEKTNEIMKREHIEPVHEFFGLTYSNYLVLHRTLMQQMPLEWQKNMVALLEEMEQRCKGINKPSSFIVQAAEEQEVGSLEDEGLTAAGVSAFQNLNEDGGFQTTYCDKEGNELENWQRVLIPIDDPVPHYRDRNFCLPSVNSSES